MDELKEFYVDCEVVAHYHAKVKAPNRDIALIAVDQLISEIDLGNDLENVEIKPISIAYEDGSQEWID